MDYFADVFKDRIGDEVKSGRHPPRLSARARIGFAPSCMGWTERDLGATATE
ncbi:MAG TPA: hypothetical protein PKE00_07045 [Planctomycetota bacterium]|nr:hypothetical protein [Planctomycetota bacterium]